MVRGRHDARPAAAVSLEGKLDAIPHHWAQRVVPDLRTPVSVITRIAGEAARSAMAGGRLAWRETEAAPAPVAKPSSPVGSPMRAQLAALSLAHATHQSFSNDFEANHVGPMSRRKLRMSLAHIEPEAVSSEKDTQIRLTSLAVQEVPGVLRHACRRVNRVFRPSKGQQKAIGEQKMRGKVAVITGANQGIGLATTKAMARDGAEVVMACRRGDACERARKEVVEETGNKKVSCVQCDLSSLHSVANCASQVRRRYNDLDFLVLNAGVIMVPFQRTRDGFEMHFGVNHLAHFYLTSQLLPLLKRRGGSRVVSISSRAHGAGSIDRIEPKEGHDYCRVTAYASSKLANLLFTQELDRRLRESGAHTRAVAVHPGVVATEGGARSSTAMERLRWMLKTPSEGAESVLHAALGPSLSGGEYIEDEAPRAPSRKVLDRDASTKLWERSSYLIDRAMYT